MIYVFLCLSLSTLASTLSLSLSLFATHAQTLGMNQADAQTTQRLIASLTIMYNQTL